MKATYEFEIGDVVMLKSGGPFMTIDSIVDNIAHCVYFGDTPCGYTPDVYEGDFLTNTLIYMVED